VSGGVLGGDVGAVAGGGHGGAPEHKVEGVKLLGMADGGEDPQWRYSMKGTASGSAASARLLFSEGMAGQTL
jgi:hypothetical protein